MDTYSNPAGISLKTNSFSLLEACYDKMPEKIAVLFTDIIGSTTYFRTHGDRKGREMLGKHYDIVTTVVSEHGGKVVKMIGDSVMVYFTDAMEALKAAIKMQQRFDDMEVRIGIHYGTAIIENKDLYGDIVNGAAKIANIGEGSQIYVSKEVYEITCSMDSVYFESIPPWFTKGLPEGLTIYKAVWDDSIDLNPAMYFILICNPVWTIYGNYFNDVWDNILKKKIHLWEEKTIINEHVLSDKTIVLVLKEFEIVKNVVKAIKDYLNEKLTQKNKHLLIPVRFIIEKIESFKEDEYAVNAYTYELKEMKPGTIYITENAWNTLTEHDENDVEKVSETYREQQLLRLTFKDEEQKLDNYLFLYRSELIEGEYHSCFYCGSKKHKPLYCPSKKIPDLTHAIDKLGHLSIDSINWRFLKFLMNDDISDDMANEKEKDTENDERFPLYGFYDLTRFFQLRFLRTIWSADDGEWDTVKNIRSKVDGGLLWLAQDSLRISDLKKTKDIIDKVLEDNACDNFKAYCLLGLLHIDNNDMVQAEFCLQNALLNAGKTINKIFVLFLLARLYFLKNNFYNASKMLIDIFNYDPNCIDAQYFDIIIKFYLGQETLALQRLSKLIQSDRTYFIYALIDPNLTPFSVEIDSLLRTLLDDSKENALSSIEMVKREFELSRPVLDDNISAEIESMITKLNNIYYNKSYFGYLDIPFYADSIIKKCRSSMKGRKKSLSEQLWHLDRRILKNLLSLDACKFPQLVISDQKALLTMKERVKTARDEISPSGKQLMEWENICVEFNKKLNIIESHLKKVSLFQKLLNNFMKFLKNSTICFGIVILAGFLVFPVIIYYLNTVFSKLNINFNIWFSQNTFLVVGSIVALCLSFIMTLKDIMKKG